MRDTATRLARRLAALPEPAMRRAVLAEDLAGRPPEDAVRMLHELVRAVRARPAPPYTIAVMALAATLDESAGLPYELRATLYAAAKEAGLFEVARLFFAAAPGPEREPDEPDAERVLEPRGRPITLGERKSLARGSRRDLLPRLLRDPDPAVIKILLENPRLTERDVVFVAARRPVRGDVLRIVFASRWIARHDVKRALALNPWTPCDVALRLLAALDPHDLREIADDPNLADAVRAQARALLDDAGVAGGSPSGSARRGS